MRACAPECTASCSVAGPIGMRFTRKRSWGTVQMAQQSWRRARLRLHRRCAGHVLSFAARALTRHPERRRGGAGAGVRARGRGAARARRDGAGADAARVGRPSHVSTICARYVQQRARVAWAQAGAEPAALSGAPTAGAQAGAVPDGGGGAPWRAQPRARIHAWRSRVILRQRRDARGVRGAPRICERVRTRALWLVCTLCRT